MVLMRGNKRVFETPNVETSSSGSVRTVSIYGVTSYNDIIDCLIPIKSNAAGTTGINTLNINNLGALDIKYFKNGIKSPIDISNWVASDQIYYVYYDGTDFVLFNNSSGSSSQTQNVYIVNVDLNSLVAGTYTAAQLEIIIDINIFDMISNYGILLYDSTSNIIYDVLNNGVTEDSVNNTNTYKFSILNGTDLVEYTIVLDFNAENYTVTINTIDLSLRNGNNIYF